MRRIVYVFLFLSFFSCNQGFEDKLETKIQELCGDNNSCKLDMSKVTDFEWDKMYFFELGCSSIIDSIIGTKFIYVDMSRVLIFTKANKVVYYEIHPEKPDIRKVDFCVPEDPTHINCEKCYIALSHENAIFNVQKIKDNGRIYYMLKLSKP